jgi:predicted nucleotidyltransferase
MENKIKKYLAEIEDKEQYKLKKFFYALRASVASKWILDKRDIPPIIFPMQRPTYD